MWAFAAWRQPGNEFRYLPSHEGLSCPGNCEGRAGVSEEIEQSNVVSVHALLETCSKHTNQNLFTGVESCAPLPLEVFGPGIKLRHTHLFGYRAESVRDAENSKTRAWSLTSPPELLPSLCSAICEHSGFAVHTARAKHNYSKHCILVLVQPGV